MWSYGFKYDLLKTLSNIHVNTIKNGKGEFQNKSLAKNFPLCHSMQFGYNNFKRTLLDFVGVFLQILELDSNQFEKFGVFPK